MAKTKKNGKATNPPSKVPSLTLTARCVGGKHKWQMTPEQIAEAQSFGCAMCPECGMPATIERASAVL